MCCAEIQTAFKANLDCFDHATSAEEKGRQFSIELAKGSAEKFCRVHVDGCLIDDSALEKCDYVFLRCSNSDIYFVELKGRDVEKAFDQIVATIGHFKAKMKLEQRSIFGFIVASKVKLPKGSTDIANMKKQFAKKHGKALAMQTNKLLHRV